MNYGTFRKWNNVQHLNEFSRQKNQKVSLPIRKYKNVTLKRLCTHDSNSAALWTRQNYQDNKINQWFPQASEMESNKDEKYRRMLE